MSDGKRPGGLTALAVLNFVFGGLGALAVLGTMALLGSLDQATGGELSTEIAKQPGAGLLWFQLLLGVATVGLMITAGVGYLGQKRFLGRTIGNAYAVTSLASTVIGIVAVGFNMMTLIGFIYPVLTLALINTTFKDDLVN